MPRSPILRTGVSFGLSAPAAVVSTLLFVEGQTLHGAIWAFTAICCFVTGGFGLWSLKTLIDEMEQAKAIHEERTR